MDENLKRFYELTDSIYKQMVELYDLWIDIQSDTSLQNENDLLCIENYPFEESFDEIMNKWGNWNGAMQERKNKNI